MRTLSLLLLLMLRSRLSSCISFCTHCPEKQQSSVSISCTVRCAYTAELRHSCHSSSKEMLPAAAHHLRVNVCIVQ
jgi:hypothetical protein